jgi:hypothetical protein
VWKRAAAHQLSQRGIPAWFARARACVAQALRAAGWCDMTKSGGDGDSIMECQAAPVVHLYHAGHDVLPLSMGGLGFGWFGVRSVLVPRLGTWATSCIRLSSGQLRAFVSAACSLRLAVTVSSLFHAMRPSFTLSDNDAHPVCHGAAAGGMHTVHVCLVRTLVSIE